VRGGRKEWGQKGEYVSLALRGMDTIGKICIDCNVFLQQEGYVLKKLPV